MHNSLLMAFHSTAENFILKCQHLRFVNATLRRTFSVAYHFKGLSVLALRI
jgi:hypothetical protein